MFKKPLKIVENRKFLFAVPIVLVIALIIANILMGTQVAIEFRGGTMLTYSYSGEIDLDAVKSEVESKGVGTVKVTMGSSLGAGTNEQTLQISFTSADGLTADVQNELSDSLKKRFEDNTLEIVSSQDVNPTSGGEFFLKCAVAVIFSFILLVIYIAFRFKKIGGLSAGVFALVALMHDIIMVYGVFVVLRFSIDANFMAVVLTMLGNSINNTIVVYDRVRENRGLYGSDMPLKELVNLSITQSITRSIATTLTTGFAIVAICIVCAVFGVTSIMTFALPMAIGLVCGTYSSLFIAGPLWVLWQEKFGKNYTDGSSDNTLKKDNKKASSGKNIDPKKLMV